MNPAYLTKRIRFSAMHQLGSPSLAPAENKRIFGKCCNQHGHDYYVEVTVKGAIDENSGLSCNRDYFDQKLQEVILDRFDKSNLNDFFPNTTGEILAQEFFMLLQRQLQPLEVVGIRLQETPKNHFFAGTPEFYKLQVLGF